MAKAKSARTVLVTTEFRGVFFGELEDDTQAPAKIVLRRARMIVYWSASVRGVLGLAADGPDKACKITSPVSRAEIWRVTGVFEVSPSAAEKFEAAPWS